MDGLNESQYSAPSSGNGVATMVITMADRTNEEKDLALVQELLAGPAGIMLERIEATSEGARPDFRLVSWRGFAGFCEVKSPATRLDEQLEQAPPLTVVGGARSDPTFNRIARNIEKAVRQFDAVNPDHGVPNVLVLVNHDDNSGFADLCETLTGQFRSDSGDAYPTNMRIATRLGDKRKRIDLDLLDRRLPGSSRDWRMALRRVPGHTAALRSVLVNLLPKKTSAA